MGRQINFYIHPNYCLDFEVLLKATGDIVLLPYYHYDNKLRTVPTTLPADIISEVSKPKKYPKQNEIWLTTISQPLIVMI